jgi:hypothetical protein
LAMVGGEAPHFFQWGLSPMLGRRLHVVLNQVVSADGPLGLTMWRHFDKGGNAKVVPPLPSARTPSKSTKNRSVAILAQATPGASRGSLIRVTLSLPWPHQA